MFAGSPSAVFLDCSITLDTSVTCSALGVTTLMVFCAGVDDTGGVCVEAWVGDTVFTGAEKVRLRSDASPGENMTVSCACIVPIQKVISLFMSSEPAVRTNFSPNVPPLPIFPDSESSNDCRTLSPIFAVMILPTGAGSPLIVTEPQTWTGNGGISSAAVTDPTHKDASKITIAAVRIRDIVFLDNRFMSHFTTYD